jgi:uncharacterized membrane protein
MFPTKKTLFFIVLLLAIGIRLAYLDKGINSDEGHLLTLARLDLNQLIPVLQTKDVYPPVSAFLLHFWMRISDSEAWIRLYFVSFGVLLCLLIFLIDRNLKEEEFPLFSFFIASFSPLLVWSSQFIRSYIEAAFWATASVYFLFKIIKGNDRKPAYWAGYILTAAISLYTFYFNIFVILAQNMVMFIYYFKDTRRMLKKWILAQAALLLLFIPGIFLAVSQFHNADAINPYNIGKSFKFLNFHIGLYGKAFLSLIGTDPSFTFSAAMKDLPGLLNILFLVILPAGISVFFLVYIIRMIKNTLPGPGARSFFILLGFFYMLFYMLAVELANFPVLTKYFLVPHVLFILVLSGIMSGLKKRASKVLLLLIFLVIYTSRLPAALEPEFDSKKAYRYIVSQIGPADCLVMVRNTNYYLNSDKCVILKDVLIRDVDSGDYIAFTKEGTSILGQLKDKYSIIWFYKTSTNDEIFGGNRLVQDWFIDNGFYPETVKKFKRIEIVKYQRKIMR